MAEERNFVHTNAANIAIILQLWVILVVIGENNFPESDSKILLNNVFTTFTQSIEFFSMCYLVKHLCVK